MIIDKNLKYVSVSRTKIITNKISNKSFKLLRKPTQKLVFIRNCTTNGYIWITCECSWHIYATRSWCGNVKKKVLNQQLNQNCGWSLVCLQYKFENMTNVRSSDHLFLSPNNKNTEWNDSKLSKYLWINYLKTRWKFQTVALKMNFYVRKLIFRNLFLFLLRTIKPFYIMKKPMRAKSYFLLIIVVSYSNHICILCIK